MALLSPLMQRYTQYSLIDPKKAEEGYKKVVSGAQVTPMDIGLYLDYGLKKGLFTEDDVPQEWLKYRDVARVHPSKPARVASDIAQKALQTLTLGVSPEYATPKTAPEASAATSAVGAGLGIAGLIPLFGAAAGTGGLLSRAARMAGAGAGIESARNVTEGKSPVAGALRGAALYGGGEAVLSPVVGAILRRLGAKLPRAATPAEATPAPEAAATRGWATLAKSKMGKKPSVVGAKVSRGAIDALARDTSAGKSVEQQRLSDVLSQLLGKRTREAEMASGQYRAVGPGVPEPPIAVTPEGLALPASRLPGSPRGKSPGGIAGLLPPGPQRSLLPGPRLALPEGRVTMPERELLDLAELKQAAAYRLHEAMVNDIKQEATTMWEAAGGPAGNLDDFAREVAKSRGYDYDAVMSDIGKSLDAHAAELSDIANWGTVTGVVPRVSSTADMTRLLKSAEPQYTGAVAPVSPEGSIGIAGGLSPRTREFDEMLRYMAATPKRSSPGGLAEPRMLGAPTEEELSAIRPRRVAIPAAERVPNEPRRLVTAPGGPEPIRESERIVRGGGQLPPAKDLLYMLQELASRSTEIPEGTYRMAQGSKPWVATDTGTVLLPEKLLPEQEQVLRVIAGLLPPGPKVWPVSRAGTVYTSGESPVPALTLRKKREPWYRKKHEKSQKSKKRNER